MEGRTTTTHTLNNVDTVIATCTAFLEKNKDELKPNIDEVRFQVTELIRIAHELNPENLENILDTFTSLFQFVNKIENDELIDQLDSRFTPLLIQDIPSSFKHFQQLCLVIDLKNERDKKREKYVDVLSGIITKMYHGMDLNAQNFPLFCDQFDQIHSLANQQNPNLTQFFLLKKYEVQMIYLCKSGRLSEAIEIGLEGEKLAQSGEFKHLAGTFSNYNKSIENKIQNSISPLIHELENELARRGKSPTEIKELQSITREVGNLIFKASQSTNMNQAIASLDETLVKFKLPIFRVFATKAILYQKIFMTADDREKIQVNSEIIKICSNILEHYPEHQAYYQLRATSYFYFEKWAEAHADIINFFRFEINSNLIPNWVQLINLLLICESNFLAKEIAEIKENENLTEFGDELVLQGNKKMKKEIKKEARNKYRIAISYYTKALQGYQFDPNFTGESKLVNTFLKRAEARYRLDLKFKAIQDVEVALWIIRYQLNVATNTNQFENVQMLRSRSAQYELIRKKWKTELTPQSSASADEKSTRNLTRKELIKLEEHQRKNIKTEERKAVAVAQDKKNKEITEIQRKKHSAMLLQLIDVTARRAAKNENEKKEKERIALEKLDQEEREKKDAANKAAEQILKQERERLRRERLGKTGCQGEDIANEILLAEQKRNQQSASIDFKYPAIPQIKISRQRLSPFSKSVDPQLRSLARSDTATSLTSTSDPSSAEFSSQSASRSETPISVASSHSNSTSPTCFIHDTFTTTPKNKPDQDLNIIPEVYQKHLVLADNKLLVVSLPQNVVTQSQILRNLDNKASLGGGRIRNELLGRSSEHRVKNCNEIDNDFNIHLPKKLKRIGNDIMLDESKTFSDEKNVLTMIQNKIFPLSLGTTALHPKIHRLNYESKLLPPYTIWSYGGLPPQQFSPNEIFETVQIKNDPYWDTLPDGTYLFDDPVLASHLACDSDINGPISFQGYIIATEAAIDAHNKRHINVPDKRELLKLEENARKKIADYKAKTGENFIHWVTNLNTEAYYKAILAKINNADEKNIVPTSEEIAYLRDIRVLLRNIFSLSYGDLEFSEAMKNSIPSSLKILRYLISPENPDHERVKNQINTLLQEKLFKHRFDMAEKRFNLFSFFKVNAILFPGFNEALQDPKLLNLFNHILKTQSTLDSVYVAMFLIQYLAEFKKLDSSQLQDNIFLEQFITTLVRHQPMFQHYFLHKYKFTGEINQLLKSIRNCFEYLKSDPDQRKPQLTSPAQSLPNHSPTSLSRSSNDNKRDHVPTTHRLVRTRFVDKVDAAPFTESTSDQKNLDVPDEVLPTRTIFNSNNNTGVRSSQNDMHYNFAGSSYHPSIQTSRSQSTLYSHLSHSGHFPVPPPMHSPQPMTSSSPQNNGFSSPFSQQVHMANGQIGFSPTNPGFLRNQVPGNLVPMQIIPSGHSFFPTHYLPNMGNLAIQPQLMHNPSKRY